MKKLYFLNEEESNRILNLHKDATKRQYLNVLTEQVQFYKGSDGKVGKLLGPYDLPQGATKITQQEYDTQIKTQTPVDAEAVVVDKPEEQTPTPVVQKPVQSVNKPLVMDIQKKLREKEHYLGNTGDNKDGVDGVMGKLTLNGIISLLGGPEPLKTITAKPLAKKSTEDLMNPITTAGTPAAGTPEAAAAATAGTPAAGTPAAGTPAGRQRTKFYRRAVE
jgi:hypothetical protein